MSLEQAVLGFLGYSGFTGYDLKKVFDASIRHFWGADRSQIYRTLAQLEKRGLAKAETVPQDGKPAKKIYRITEVGRTAFRQWLSSPLPPNEIRDASLIQMFFAADLPDETVIELLSARVAGFRTRLRHYEAIQVIEETDYRAPSDREAFFWSLTLEQGIRSIQASLAWLEHVIARIERGEAPKAEGERE